MLDETEPFFLSHETARFAAKQFKYADSAHARDAVLLEIRVLRLLQRWHPDVANQDPLGSAHVRLAMIEEAAGRKTAEQNALEQARACFKKGHPSEELTNEQMKNAVRRMDEAWDRAGL